MPSLSSPDQAEPEIATTDLVGRVIVRLATPISYLVWVLQLFSDYEPADEWRRDAVNVTTVHELRTALVARMQFCIVLIIYPVVLGIAIGALIGWISSLGEDGWLTILALAPACTHLLLLFRACIRSQIRAGKGVNAAYGASARSHCTWQSGRAYPSASICYA
jgi:hypothetical protein